MSSNNAIAAPNSRPKIHRLPASLSPRRKTAFDFFPLAHVRKSVRMAVLLVVVSAALFIAARFTGPAPQATVTVSATRLEPSAGDAMASIPEMAVITSEPDAKTIHIEGKHGAIVGQLAKIPSESGEISDIKTVSEVDNRAGRELLSIISKY